MLCLGHAVPAGFPSYFCGWTSLHRSVTAGQGSRLVALVSKPRGEVAVQVGTGEQAMEPVHRGGCRECWLCGQPSPNLSATYHLSWHGLTDVFL